MGRVVVTWKVLRGPMPAPHLCEHLTLLRGQKINEEKKHGSQSAVTARVTERDLNEILITLWNSRKASKGI